MNCGEHFPLLVKEGKTPRLKQLPNLFTPSMTAGSLQAPPYPALIERRYSRILDLMSDLDYKGYLKLDELLKLQQPLADPPSHDETLFIIVHQVFELWFKLALHEIDKIFEMLDQGDVIESERLIRRLTSIIRLFIPKLSVLETMMPSDFIQFRDRLRPASGFQSVQFREIEFACGLKDRKYLGMFKNDPAAAARLEKRLTEPAFWDHFIALLYRRGYRTDTEESQRQGIVSIYKRDGEH